MGASTHLVLALAATLVPLAAQQPQEGEPAPPITLDAWLNVGAGETPTLESLRGRVVMVEFWGTWCGPCVRSMPEVQKMHDRYREQGLTVLAISYEKPEVLRPFLEQHAYTMAVGSDPERKVVTPYHVRGWPSTYLIDKEGRIAWVGSPYGVEAAIEKALGLESSPGTLLTAWFETTPEASRETRRAALARLVQKATADFDLRAWALANAAAEQRTEADTGATSRPAPKEAAHKGPALDADDLLRRCAAAWKAKTPAQREEILRRLADAGPVSFDLASWAGRTYAKAFPLEQKELADLLQQQKFADAVEAIATRNPGSPALAVAARHEKLRDYCRKKAEDLRASAKKAIMAQGWVFGSVRPADNEAFWKELSVSGMSFSEDRKQVLGILIDGATVSRAMAEGFIRNRLSQALVMEAIGAGKAPKVQELETLAAREKQKILRPLEQSYGALPGKAGK